MSSIGNVDILYSKLIPSVNFQFLMFYSFFKLFSTLVSGPQVSGHFVKKDFLLWIKPLCCLFAKLCIYFKHSLDP